MRVLFLDLDSTSPDHLGCYGYHRNTSPNIDKIAAEGVRFTNYYTSDAPCAPSRTALMSGQFGIRNGLVGHGGTAGDMKLEGEKRQLFGKLSQGGSFPSYLNLMGNLNTVLISPFPQRHSTFGFYAGFNETLNTGKFGNESAEHVTPVALDWLIEMRRRMIGFYISITGIRIRLTVLQWIMGILLRMTRCRSG
jgi:choline-sulfatase